MASIFSRIINREIPARIVHEDDQCMAFHDLNPQAPVHVLIIPKKEIQRVALAESSDEPLLGHLLTVAASVASKIEIGKTGFRLVINNGPHGGETVPHLHVHLLGGRPMLWPPG